jgi:hypothetical protein
LLRLCKVAELDLGADISIAEDIGDVTPVFTGGSSMAAPLPILSVSTVNPASIGVLEIIGELDGAVAAGVGEVGQDEGGQGHQEASEVSFHCRSPGHHDRQRNGLGARSMMVLASAIH